MNKSGKLKRVNIDEETKEYLLKLYKSAAKDGHDKLTLNDVLKSSLERTVNSKEQFKVSLKWTLDDVLSKIRKEFKADLNEPLTISRAKKISLYIKKKSAETEEAVSGKMEKETSQKACVKQKSVSSAVSTPVSKQTS